ncbi:hypothetical protein [Metallosphaera tengchongensis]|uniref:hypothetical protein n=1 Tax=Metallosphaera tengchongensis TaxID=1532350 RepID=UPI00157D88A8|nr:hypothetical protein [Metallosphaera tengchongensis]
MISWLIGGESPSWDYLRDLFQDVENAAVYVNSSNVVEVVKVSDLSPFHSQVTVLIHPMNVKFLRPIFIKLKGYVTFPLARLRDVRELVERRNWRAIEYYHDWEFMGSWILYDCEDCEEAQRAHLSVDFNDEKAKEMHLEIWKSKNQV